ncbi:MAG: IscS subfamily cysteine desulfurase [Thermoplasmata archaeon]|nr:IscS subfamily cysteine desulfurase [Thermoplasmata archaeon]
MKRVYMDYDAATPVDPKVLESMMPFFTEHFGNPSSVYSLGFEAKAAIEEAREKVARLTNAPKDGVVFTSSGTESNNLAIRGTAYQFKDKGKHIITSEFEHDSVLKTITSLEKEGFESTQVPVDETGIVDVEELKKSIRDDTILITVMYANNEVGTIQPIREIGAIAKEKGILLHSDALAAAGKIPTDMDKDNMDLVSIGSQEIYGPKGVAALCFSSKRFKPLLHGGRQEMGKRPGTENVPAIIGFGTASDIALEKMESEATRLSTLRDKLIEGITGSVKDSFLNGHPTKRLPTNANIRFDYIEGESIVLNLDSQGIQVATGSACASDSLQPSHVLLAMGVTAEEAHGSLQFNLGRGNTEEDIDYVLQVVSGVVENLRKMSPMTPDGFFDE